jgi:DNA topoisomerase-1
LARRILVAIDRVAGQLGNTRSVCRKCYVHPAVLDAYLAGYTIGRLASTPRNVRGLHEVEARLVSLLQGRRGRTAYQVRAAA